MNSATITFEQHRNMPGFYWLIIRVGVRVIGSITKNEDNSIDKDFYLQVRNSYGNTVHAGNYLTVEKAKEAFFKLPLSILPVA